MTISIRLHPHELDTINFLAQKGHKIEILRPTLTPKNHNPDIFMDGLVWEMKSPTTANKTTIKRLLKEASRQSENIIVDLRRAKVDDRTSIKILKNEYSLRRVIKKVKIITKQGDELNLLRK